MSLFWEQGERTLVGQVVAVGFLVRLLAVATGMAGLVGRPLSVTAVVLILLLSTTSFVALSRPGVIALLARHPLLAMLDLLVVLSVLFLMGVQSPLTLGALSTALLTGLLFPWPAAFLIISVLVSGHVAMASVAQVRPGENFLVVVGLPVTYVCLVAIGLAVKQMAREQMAAQQRLAEVLRADVTRDERQRLAREMHDSLAKTIQGVALTAAALPLQARGSSVAPLAEQVAAGARQAVTDARTLLAHMRRDSPSKPFRTVVEETCSQWSQQSGVRCRVSADDVHGLPAATRYELLASMSELLENVARHAEARAVDVALLGGDSVVTLRVVDDGRGFDLALLPEREAEGHFGVRGVTERMEVVGGQAHFETSPGRGTTVVLTAPVTVAEEEALQ